MRAKNVEVVKGNILLATQHIILQQVNCQGVMGSGLALQLRRKYAGLYEAYKNHCNARSSPNALMGTVCWYYYDPEETGKPVKTIASIFGQLTYGRRKNTVYTDYDALAKGLLEVSKRARSQRLTTAIPYGLGCGLGGGDWRTVLAMINSKETFVNRFVKIYKFEENK